LASWSICNELIDHGADLYRPTAPARGGTTSAHYLARLPWTVETEAVWRRVYSVRCETDVRDAVGRTPLFDAASKNRAATIRFLLAQGADGNARAHDGSTALHTAVASNAMDAVQALIAANVELLDADEIGTARSLAHKLGVADIAELLDGYHHTLYSVASPRSKQFMSGDAPRARARVAVGRRRAAPLGGRRAPRARVPQRGVGVRRRASSATAPASPTAAAPSAAAATATAAARYRLASRRPRCRRRR
jgi:hypothetical protein